MESKQHSGSKYGVFRSLLFIFSISLSLFAEAKTEPPSIDDFSSERDLRDMEISPNGKYMAAIWNFGQKRVVTVQDLTQKGYPIVAKFGDSIQRPHYINWANDSRMLIKMQIPVGTDSARKKSEKKDDFDIYDYSFVYRTLATDFDGRNPVVLMQSARIHNYLIRDPDHVLMSTYDNDKKALFKVNVNSGKTQRIARGGPHTVDFITDIDGKVKYRFDYLRVAKSVQIYKYSENKKWEKDERIHLYKKEENKIDLDGLAGLLSDGSLAYIKENEKTGYDELISKNQETKEEKVLISLPDKDVINTLINTRTQEVVGYLVEKDDVIYRQYFDQEKQKAYDEIAAQVKEIGGSSFSIYSRPPGNNIGIIQTNGQNDPGIFHLYNFEEKELTFYQYQKKALTPDKLGIPATTNYLTRDGVKIRSYITLPLNYEEGKSYPLVVLPHGGPQDRDYAYFDEYAQFIATRGYVVIQPNFRGSTGYGKEFEEAGYKQWGGIMQDDLEDAVHFMVKKGFANPDKVCIVGGSYGGYAALMGTIKNSKLYKCAISINGVADLIDIVKYDEKKFKKHPKVIDFIHRSIGNHTEDSETLRYNSPVLRAKEVGAPILLIAGKEDKIVPFRQSKAMSKALKKAKKEFKLVDIEHAGHNITYYRNHRDEVYEETEAFLKEHLGD